MLLVGSLNLVRILVQSGVVKLLKITGYDNYAAVKGSSIDITHQEATEPTIPSGKFVFTRLYGLYIDPLGCL